MRRRQKVLTLAATLVVAGVAGYSLWSWSAKPRPPAPAVQQAAIAYYQDPDGKPAYALHPRQTADGRDYRAVLVTEDVNFTPAPEPVLQPGSRKIAYYRNPMGLPDTSPTPKKDSMGMDYIPVYEGEDNDPAIKLSPGRIQRSGVLSEPAQLRPVRPALIAPGVVQLDERRVAVISLRTESWIQKIEDVTTGSRVRKGQPLMHLYSPAISSAGAELAAIAKFQESQVGNGLAGVRQRLLNLGTPETVIEKIRTTGEAPISVEWLVPRDGIVLERNATEGMRAEPGAALFRIADTSVLWILFDVPESALGTIAVGQRAFATAKSFPGRTFEGVVKTIYPQINRETRTAKVRVEVPNSDQLLLPDMYVEGEIVTGRPDPVISVAESAVVDSGRKQIVFIDKGNGVIAPREVTTGERGGGFVEITSGVQDGEAVVSSANFLLDAESNLRAAVKGYSEAGASK